MNMKILRIIPVLFLLSGILCPEACADPIKVYLKMRGDTGIEEKVRDFLASRFESFEDVTVTDQKDKSHLYLDLSLVEQEPIRFYALGICIAYHVRDEFYSRPTSDVAQFGEGRMEDVCRYLAEQINGSFLAPLRKSSEE
ncbi:MAG: hypothetical protein GF409_08075 [Candidatus Omnitrophica bacterium]|nr:hypothetical protein [Candidatus Omnitrophota bacterium]